MDGTPDHDFRAADEFEVASPRSEWKEQVRGLWILALLMGMMATYMAAPSTLDHQRPHRGHLLWIHCRSGHRLVTGGNGETNAGRYLIGNDWCRAFPRNLLTSNVYFRNRSPRSY